MNREFLFTITNDYAALGELCGSLEDFTKEMSLPDSAAYAARLVVEELVTNVIKYGYDDRKRHDIRVRAFVEKDFLVISIEDHGHEFDPTSVPPPDTGLPLEERDVGGLGLHLVRGVSESVKYRRDGGRNIVTVRVRIQPENTDLKAR